MPISKGFNSPIRFVICRYSDYVVSVGDHDHSNVSSHERMVAVDTIFVHRLYGYVSFSKIIS